MNQMMQILMVVNLTTPSHQAISSHPVIEHLHDVGGGPAVLGRRVTVTGPEVGASANVSVETLLPKARQKRNENREEQNANQT